MEFILEGSLISAQVLFSLRALFGEMDHFYTRIASFIRTRQSDLFVTRSRHFQRENLWAQLYHRIKTLLIVPHRASNHQRTPSLGVNIN